MDKNSIKKYAVWARRELISRVSQKALQYGISEKEIIAADADTVNGHLLSEPEKKQRQNLIKRIEAIGYKQTMEEAAYTWFNRFCALRFMEVNGYLPTHIRVFTDEQNAFKPQIITEAIHLELEGLDMEKVYELKDTNKTEALYKYLLITQCNALSKLLPGMFTRIADYSELLFPDYLLREGSAIEQMIVMIPEEDWRDAVQIIGWLYQYYNAEPKDEVFANLKKNIKISKENIPAATQLFTPDWIVRYMVENSLGRLWVEGHPNDELKANWKYYLEEAEQEPEVQTQLRDIRKEYAALRPEDIKCIDPCMGSGHILVYMFDVLVQIYESCGYSTRDAAGLILQNNLYGLDIDDRASQLAYFAVMMKARQYDRRIFTRGIQPHIYAIQESSGIDRNALRLFYPDEATAREYIGEAGKLLNLFADAKEYGSILDIGDVDVIMLRELAVDPLENDALTALDAMRASETYARYIRLLDVAIAMAQKYHVVVTNPPYMGASGMGNKLGDYVKKNYPDSKSDLFAVCIERGNKWVVPNGYNCMVTMQSWMFLSSFEKMRTHILSTRTITNLMHMENMVMGIAFGTAVTVFRNTALPEFKGTYNHITMADIEDERPKEFPVKGNRFAQVSTSNFSKIPGSPVAYWVSENFYRAFENGTSISSMATVFEGLKTRDKDRFVRLWHEISNSTWKPYAKGGSFRRWYGNCEYVVKWGADGREIREFKKSSGSNFEYYYQPTVTYSALTSYKFSGRFIDKSFFGGGGGGITNSDYIFLILAFVNSSPYNYIINAISPTLNFEVGQIGQQPLIIERGYEKQISNIAKECVFISRADWDSFETSWDFKRHPLVPALLSNNSSSKCLSDIIADTDCLCKPYAKNPNLDTAKKLIETYFNSRSKGCIFNIEFTNEESIFSRSEHMVSCYAIGMLLHNRIESICQAFSAERFGGILKDFDFEYVWFLCCLSHDLLSKHEKEHGSLSYSSLDEFIKITGIDHTIYNPNLPEDIAFSVPFENSYSESTVNSYFDERLSADRLDHGIAEGYLLFDLLVKNYLNERLNNDNKKDFSTEVDGHTLLWKEKQLWVFALVADAVIAHNIWHNETTVISELKTGCETEKKLSLTDNPLAYLFGIVDSIEPIKYFTNEESNQILGNVSLAIEGNAIIIRKTGATDRWYCEKVQPIPDWISEINVVRINNDIKISFGNS